MTDFAALIDRAIIRQTQSALLAFIGAYKVTEGGLARKLRVKEVTLVMAVIDDFLANDGCADLGMAEFADLRQRLARVIEREDLSATPDGQRIRNSCFDAVACIKALEARLIWRIEELLLRRGRIAASLHHANDR